MLVILKELEGVRELTCREREIIHVGIDDPIGPVGIPQREYRKCTSHLTALAHRGQHA